MFDSESGSIYRVSLVPLSIMTYPRSNSSLPCLCDSTAHFCDITRNHLTTSFSLKTWECWWPAKWLLLWQVDSLCARRKEITFLLQTANQQNIILHLSVPRRENLWSSINSWNLVPVSLSSAWLMAKDDGNSSSSTSRRPLVPQPWFMCIFVPTNLHGKAMSTARIGTSDWFKAHRNAGIICLWWITFSKLDIQMCIPEHSTPPILYYGTAASYRLKKTSILFCATRVGCFPLITLYLLGSTISQDIKNNWNIPVIANNGLTCIPLSMHFHSLFPTLAEIMSFASCLYFQTKCGLC